MKKSYLSYLIITVLAMSFGFTSCDDDDDPVAYTGPALIDTTTTLSYDVIIGANAIFTKTDTLKLEEIIPQYHKNVYRGELQGNASNLEIAGLSTGQKFSNFKLKIEGTSDELMLDSILSNQVLSGASVLEFMQKSVDRLVTNKSALVTVSFTSTTDIGPADDVKVNLNYDIDFSLK